MRVGGKGGRHVTRRGGVRGGARRGRVAAAAVLLIGVSACGHKEFDPPDRETQIAEADVLFRAIQFDTIVWEGDDARARAGNEVFARECRNCHGTLGAGATEYAQAQGLEVPSLVDQEWVFAESIDSVRHRVFVGHAGGMPTWGVAGITAGEVDAVSYYLLERLRPEILGGG